MGTEAENLTYNTGTGQQEVDGVRRQESNAQQQGPATYSATETWPRSPTQPSTSLTNTPTPEKPTIDSQKEDDSSVGHGISQPQDATPHDGVAEVEH